ncbi:hypothetical protein Ancab_036980 [Ancistrocladus abbreviatus]
MGDNEEGEGAASPRHGHEEEQETASRGNGWEVVSLTASTYAASPGPKEIESIHEERGNTTDASEAETSRALFMSGHFVFPPSQHENLPIKKEGIEKHKEDEGSGKMVTEMPEEEGGRSQQKEEEKFSNPVLKMNITEEFPGDQIFDGKGDWLAIQDPKFDEATVLRGLDIAKKEQDVYSSAKYSLLHSGTVMSESATCDDSGVMSDLNKPSESTLEPSSDMSQSLKPVKEGKDNGSELSSGAWWKKRVACLCAHAKEKNAFWSIFVAAGVMGLVILGQRWQQERWQVLEERWQDSLDHEKSGEADGSLSRFKDILVGGGRCASYISNRASADH